MTCPCQAKPDSTNNETKPDRYVSFIGLDCDIKAARLIARIYKHIDDPSHNDVFWEYFKKKAAGSGGSRPDDLLLIHSHLNEIRELFEQKADAEGMSLLDNIEQECC
jgi:N(2)-fixation sustaining protein CowN